jgi:hypothetical protein
LYGKCFVRVKRLPLFQLLDPNNPTNYENHLKSRWLLYSIRGLKFDLTGPR